MRSSRSRGDIEVTHRAAPLETEPVRNHEAMTPGRSSNVQNLGIGVTMPRAAGSIFDAPRRIAQGTRPLPFREAPSEQCYVIEQSASGSQIVLYTPDDRRRVIGNVSAGGVITFVDVDLVMRKPARPTRPKRDDDSEEEETDDTVDETVDDLPTDADESHALDSSEAHDAERE